MFTYSKCITRILFGVGGKEVSMVAFQAIELSSIPGHCTHTDFFTYLHLFLINRKYRNITYIVLMVNSKSTMVQCQNARLPHGRPGFDSRFMQHFAYLCVEISKLWRKMYSLIGISSQHGSIGNLDWFIIKAVVDYVEV